MCRFLQKIPPTKCLILAFIHFADCNHWCRSKGSITSSGQVTNEHDCSNSNITHNWKCIPTTTTKLYVYFLFHLSCYPSLTQTTKCSKIPTLKVRESFGNHYVLVYFNLTRAPGSFLVISALKAINLWLSTERACNAKLAFHLQCGKNFGCTDSPSQSLSIA